ncbi:MAG: hypothetical protein JO197_23410 [Acidobacteria bacterium]|nr:hypothetical protein [Acidobacteriota bacterium]MBV9477843.1 hypothetical protein [Acidobacteriota bacterium]
MSTTAPGELTASAVISLIESGAYPRDVVLTIARGFLPLEQEDLVAVLAYLGALDDDEISATARTALADVPSRIVAGFAANEDVEAVHLERLLGIASDPLVLEALIRNRAVSDAAVAALAARAEARVQEVIVINHARILRAPEILDALLANPTLAPEARRRALETREEFFDKKARLQQEEEEPEVVELPLEPILDLLEKARELEHDGAAAPTPSLTESEREKMKASVVWARLAYMSISEKVQLAFKGDRMLRMLLVRERVKLIASAVMRNPRLTDQEIESIAGMRNVDEEVLRMIGTRRDWISKYNLIVILCRNPKAPVGVVLPLINRLTLRDLKGLKDDKGVSQVVRETAKRIYLSRTQKTG